MLGDVDEHGARYLARWEIGDVTGPVVAIDVIRASLQLARGAFSGRVMPLDAASTASFVANSDEAVKTLQLGDGHVDPDDIVYATQVDAFDFAMEVTHVDGGLRLDVTGE